MSSFALFLREKNLASESDLARVLLDQMTSMPSIAELAHRTGLIGDHDLLRALDLQSRLKIDFRSACRQLELWAEHWDAKIEEELLSSAVPLTGLLLDRNHIDAATLATALEEYAQRRESARGSSHEMGLALVAPLAATPSAEHEKERSAESETPSPAARETAYSTAHEIADERVPVHASAMPENSQPPHGAHDVHDEEPVRTFSPSIDEKMLGRLLSRFEALTSENDGLPRNDGQTPLHAVFHEMHHLLGMARFTDATHIGDLAEIWDDILTQALLRAAFLEAPQLGLISKLGIRSLAAMTDGGANEKLHRALLALQTHFRSIEEGKTNP